MAILIFVRFCCTLNKKLGIEEDRGVPRSKFGEIYRDIKEKIEGGVYAYQALLPSENALIGVYDCSRNTVRRALSQLTEEGYVQAIHGKGVRVLYLPESKAAFTVGGIESFRETAERNHMSYTTRVVCCAPETVDARLAAASGFAEGDEVYHVERIRVIDGKALIRDINYFLCAVVPRLTSELAAGSIYSYLENELGVQIGTSLRRITVERATAADRSVLDLDGYDCLAVVTSQTFDSNGILFEYTQSRHQPAHFSFQDTAARRQG